MSEACWLYQKIADWVDRRDWNRIFKIVFCVLLPCLPPSIALERWIDKQRKLTGREPTNGDGFFSMGFLSSFALYCVVLLFLSGVWKL